MDPTKYLCIYPSYLDATKTVKQGRRIGAEKAVDTPTVSDISQALQQLNIRHVLQPHKGYSRDITCLWDNPGRVRYENLGMYSKRQLLVEIAERIPALPARIQRLEQEKKQALLDQKAKEEAAQRERQAQKQLQHQQKANSKSQKSSNKKKGKKRR